MGLELGEGVFDWIEVRGIVRQIAQYGPGGFDRPARFGSLVGGQVVHDDVSPRRRVGTNTWSM